MKNVTNKVFLIAFIFICTFSVTSCDMIDDIFDDVVSECDEKQNQINPTQPRSFQEVCQVLDQNRVHLEGVPVKMEIKKQYCDGHDAGYTVLGGNTDSNGVWDSRYVATYDFKNKKDRVLVKYTISYGGIDHEYDYVYRWEDVELGGLQYWSKTIYMP